MTLVKVTRDISVNPSAIASVEIDYRHYVNGSSSKLRISMTTGGEYIIEHNPHHLDGNDIYEIKRRLEEAIE